MHDSLDAAGGAFGAVGRCVSLLDVALCRGAGEGQWQQHAHGHKNADQHQGLPYAPPLAPLHSSCQVLAEAGRAGLLACALPGAWQGSAHGKQPIVSV